LQLLIFNEEFLVSACHQRALITSLPFVHTARRSYRLNDPVRPPDCGNAAGSPAAMPREAVQTLSFRGRRSRNKVSVGEPAEGSLPVFPPARMRTSHLYHRGVGSRGSVSSGSPPRLPVGASALSSAGVPAGVSRSGAQALESRSERVSRHVRSVRQPCAELFTERSVPSTLGRSNLSEHLKITPNTQLLSMDILALATMKNAAKCDT
jgi:hypothetical protein